MWDLLFGIHIGGLEAFVQFWFWTAVAFASLALWVRITNKREEK